MAGYGAIVKALLSCPKFARWMGSAFLAAGCEFQSAGFAGGAGERDLVVVALMTG
jgi:hypothetical protein